MALTNDGINVGPHRARVYKRPPADESPENYDPSNHTVAEVKDFVEDHPDLRDAVLAAEENAKDRSTLVEWLYEYDN